MEHELASTEARMGCAPIGPILQLSTVHTRKLQSMQETRSTGATPTGTPATEITSVSSALRQEIQSLSCDKQCEVCLPTELALSPCIKGHVPVSVPHMLSWLEKGGCTYMTPRWQVFTVQSPHEIHSCSPSGLSQGSSTYQGIVCLLLPVVLH